MMLLKKLLIFIMLKMRGFMLTILNFIKRIILQKNYLFVPRAHTRVYVYITPSELMFSCLLLVALREIKQITTNQPEYSIRMV